VKVVAAPDKQQTTISAAACALNSSRTVWRPAHASTRILAPPQGAQAEKTVDQARKNIQVLKGLPESQLFLVMNFVASSLGEQCSFCHVQQGKDPKTGFTK